MTTETQSTDLQTATVKNIDQSFNDLQLRRGLVLLIAFVAMRALLWGPFWTQPTTGEPLQYAILILVTIVVGSIGLVYLGFTRWVGVDIVTWWIDRDRLLWDVLWGLLGFVIALFAMLGLSLGFQSILGPPPGAPVTEPVSPLGTVLMLVFGFAVAAFQEETLFRGFLQTALTDRIGAWPAVVGQAIVFSLAHVGYYPLTAWYMFAMAFAGGLIYGLLRKRRGRLLVPGIAHGLVG